MDVKRRVETGFQVVLVILQNQTAVHYAMPVRVMNEDASDYYNQWKKIQKIHREKRDLQSAEFLSGFSRTDKLIPVLSIVIYFGKEPWDGPRTLRDMLDFSDCPDNIQKMIADYPINLFEVRKYEALENFHTDLQVVFGFLQHTENKEQLMNYVTEHAEELSHMAEDACDLLCVMSHTTELKKIQVDANQTGGECNVCKAIDDLKKEERENGMKIGEARGLKLGEERGEKRINLLNQRLFADQRMDDMNRAFTDRDFRQALLSEYGI
jgi:hypothetical protein